MTTHADPYRSLTERLLFIGVGAATGIGLSTAGIGGIWAIPVAIIALLVFGELFLFVTSDREQETDD